MPSQCTRLYAYLLSLFFLFHVTKQAVHFGIVTRSVPKRINAPRIAI